MEWEGRVVGVFIETQRSRGGGNGPMAKQGTEGLGRGRDRGGGTPLPPPYFVPSCFA